MLSSAPHGVAARITGARKGVIVDGAADEETLSALLEIFDRQEAGRTRRGVVRIRRTPAYAQLRGEGPLAPRALVAEQSNTSVAFGDRLIAKLFRRVEPGPNPDVEIGEHLTTKTAFRRAPRVGAFLEYEPAGEPPSRHLAEITELVKSQANGWTHALAELDRFYDDVHTRPAPPAELTPAQGPLDLAATPTPHEMRELSGAYLDDAHQLGRRTAELHVAPRVRHGGAGLRAGTVHRDDVARLAAGDRPAAVRPRIDRRLRVPASRTAAARAPRRRERPADAFSTARTRIHGDLHLGQVLWSEGDFYLIDFEGEPARSLEERRRKDSPIKDVAGMLRSFGYAAYAALFARAAGRADEVDRLEGWARAWQKWVGASFLKGYLGIAGTAPFVPEDPVQRASLLNLFLIDKALYELRYELDNRPDWARIPLRGLAELA